MTSFDTQPIDEYSNALKFQLDAAGQKLFRALFPITGIPYVGDGTLLDGIAPLLTPQTLYLLSDIDEQFNRCSRRTLGSLDTALYFDLMIAGVPLSGSNTWDNPLRRSGVFSDVEVQLRLGTKTEFGHLHDNLAQDLPWFSDLRPMTTLRILHGPLYADVNEQLNTTWSTHDLKELSGSVFKGLYEHTNETVYDSIVYLENLRKVTDLFSVDVRFLLPALLSKD